MKHARAAKEFLSNGPRTEWHSQALWYVRQKRDIQKDEIADWEDLREQASAIKEHTLSLLDQYLEEFETKSLKTVSAYIGQSMQRNITILYLRSFRKLMSGSWLKASPC